MYSEREFCEFLNKYGLLSFFVDHPEECTKALLDKKDKCVRFMSVGDYLAFGEPHET